MPRADLPFLRHIHYFRAFAIINVMLVHLTILPDWLSSYPGAAELHHFVETLFHGSTIYFLFISGFLFYYLSADFDARKYYSAKAKNVLCPYLILTAFVTLNTGFRTLLSGGMGIPELVMKYVRHVMIGDAQLQYWYIPFILTLFLASPLILRIPNKVFDSLALASALLPLLGTRSSTILSFGQYVYFMPVYLAGMFTAKHYRRVMELAAKHVMTLVVIMTASSILCFVDMEFGTALNLRESAQYINKMSITFLCLLWLRRFEDLELPLARAFGDCSFGLYFIHMLEGARISDYVYGYLRRVCPEALGAGVLPATMLVFVTVRIFAALGICLAMRKVLGRRSRYLIGV
jgi:probable poly-beta-1,6-N-acetyl-D-glucosamine export protein